MIIDSIVRHGRPQFAWSRGILLICVVLAISALPLMAVLISEYDYRHAWVSAHFAVMARNFLEHGIFALNGIPIQNNVPFTSMPDVYVNWPPLYPIFLSIVFSVFEVSEVVHHAVAVCINLGIVVLVFAVVRRQAGALAAVMSILIFLCSPLIAMYGHLGLHLHLAILFCFASLYCFGLAAEEPGQQRILQSRLALAGTGLMFLGTLSSWEPLLAVPGLLAVSSFRRDWRAFRLAIVFGLAGTSAALLVFAVYAINYPDFFAPVIDRLMVRTGFGPLSSGSAAAIVSPHLIQESNTAYDFASAGSYLIDRLIPRLMLLGPIGLMSILAVSVFATRKNTSVQIPGRYIVVGMVSVCVGWAIVFRQHMFIHDYQYLLLVPVGALCTGFVFSDLRHTLERRYLIETAQRYMYRIAAVTAVIAILGRAGPTIQLYSNFQGPDQHPSIQFAKHIQNSSAPNAIIVHSENSMVPVYYSKRHVVRGVKDAKMLAKYREAIWKLCSDCPIYVAVPNAAKDRFEPVAQTSIAQSKHKHGTLHLVRNQTASAQ